MRIEIEMRRQKNKPVVGWFHKNRPYKIWLDNFFQELTEEDLVKLESEIAQIRLIQELNPTERLNR